MARTVKFTSGGALAGDGTSGAAIPRGGEINTHSGEMSNEHLVGFTFKGFTSVALYDGTDNTGTLVAYADAPGTYDWNEPVWFVDGVFIEVGGAGTGSLWIAGG